MLNRDYIIAALKSGFQISQIADGLGVTDSAVKQYVDTNNLAEIANKNSRFARLDETLNSIEEKVAHKLNKVMDMAVLQPGQLAGILKIVNGTKRRSLAEGHMIQDNSVRLIQLNLPERSLPQVERSGANEIIAVEGRTLQTIPSGKIQQLSEVTYEKPQIADLL